MCYSELFWGYFFRNTTKWADGKLHSLQKRFSFDDTLFIFLYRLARLIRYFSEFTISCVWKAVQFRYFLVHYQSGHFRINVVITEWVGKWMDGWVSDWLVCGSDYRPNGCMWPACQYLLVLIPIWFTLFWQIHIICQALFLCSSEHSK